MNPGTVRMKSLRSIILALIRSLLRCSADWTAASWSCQPSPGVWNDLTSCAVLTLPYIAPETGAVRLRSRSMSRSKGVGSGGQRSTQRALGMIPANAQGAYTKANTLKIVQILSDSSQLAHQSSNRLQSRSWLMKRLPEAKKDESAGSVDMVGHIDQCFSFYALF